MAVIHQLEITREEALSALSNEEALDAKTKATLDQFKEKYGEMTEENKKSYSVASRVMVYYALTDPAGIRGRLASVLPGDTVIIGGDAPTWYYILAALQAMKFNPGCIKIQINEEQTVTVFSSQVTDLATHVTDNKWLSKEEMEELDKQIPVAKQEEAPQEETKAE